MPHLQCIADDHPACRPLEAPSISAGSLRKTSPKTSDNTLETLSEQILGVLPSIRLKAPKPWEKNTGALLSRAVLDFLGAQPGTLHGWNKHRWLREPMAKVIMPLCIGNSRATPTVGPMRSESTQNLKADTHRKWLNHQKQVRASNKSHK